MRSFYAAVILSSAVFLPAAAHADSACYEWETETAGAILTIDIPEGDGPVTGVEHGGVNDEKEGYFTSWESRITGTRSGDQLKLDIVSAVEVDFDSAPEEALERVTETWTLQGDGIKSDRYLYKPVDCSKLEGNTAEPSSESGMNSDPGFDQVAEHGADDISRGHCLDSDDVILTCEIDEDNVLSVCASKDRKAVSYGYGPVVMPEMTYPEEANGSAAKFKIHSIGYSGGYDTRLAFSRGQTTYVVYEQMISKGPDTEEKDMMAGVTVYDGKQQIADKACLGLGGAGLGLNQLYDVVPKEEFFDESGLK